MNLGYKNSPFPPAHLGSEKGKRTTLLGRTATKGHGPKPAVTKQATAPQTKKVGQQHNPELAQEPDAEFPSLTRRADGKRVLRRFQPRQAAAAVPQQANAPASTQRAFQRQMPQKVRQELRTRSELDLGFQHFLRGNAPQVLAEFVPARKDKTKETYSNDHIVQRFLDEEDESGLPFPQPGKISPRVSAGVKSARTEAGGDFLGADHGGRDLFSENSEWSMAKWSSDELGALVQLEAPRTASVPEFVPGNSRGRYRRSGLTFAASFLGLIEA